jgi:hypothetical protein
MFAYADALKELLLETDFIYLGIKEIYCILKTRCIISVLFSTNHTLNFK